CSTWQTACDEEMPTGVSTIAQRWSPCYSRLRAPSRASQTASMLVIGASGEAALDRRRAPQLLDPLGFPEPLVDAEADVGRELEVHLPGDHAAHVALVAIERREHLRLVAPAERHHVDGREAGVGAHADLGNRDEMRLDHRIVHLAVREELGDGVTHRLADAQLALRGAACGLAMLSAGHSFNLIAVRRAFPAPNVVRSISVQFPGAKMRQAEVSNFRACAAPSPPGSTRSCRPGACPGNSRTPCRIPGRRGLRARRP